MDQHDLVCKLKALAIELGRTPNKNEFAGSVQGGHYQITKFGGYTTLCQAAGLETYDERRSKGGKITNAIFNRDIERHLEEFTPRPKASEPYPSIACISDVHRPFQSERVVKAFLEYVGDVKPEWVVENGDGRDQFSHGRFPRSHNIFTPREEQALARRQHEEFWAEVLRRSPASKCRLMLGNHELRPLKQILEHIPSAEDWIRQALEQDLTFTNVQSIFDPRQELKIGSILIFHGYRGKLGDHTAYTQSHCITGHSHQGGVVFRMGHWELNCGFAGDPEAKGLTYTQQKLTNWTNGFGAVDRLGPRFIPV